MNSKVRTGLLVLKEKKRVVVGEGPFLVADRVTDFSVTCDASRGVEIVAYTEPEGTRFDIEGGKVLRNSAPVQVKFELRRRGNS
jgi:hypothetical protein